VTLYGGVLETRGFICGFGEEEIWELSESENVWERESFKRNEEAWTTINELLSDKQIEQIKCCRHQIALYLAKRVLSPFWWCSIQK